MGRRFETVSFLSDYGTADEFVGVVTSVLRDLAPHVAVVHLTHEIPPFDVRAGALTLARCVPYVASGVVLAVVDPGVGTSRRIVAVEVAEGKGVLIGPDNGLLAPAVSLTGGPERVVEVANPELRLPAAGVTFAGRDVMAPAAAHLCNGGELTDLGPAVDPAGLVPSLVPVAAREGDVLRAEVLWVDRFGNAQLNLSDEDLTDFGDRIELRRQDHPTRVARRVATFGELGPGEVGLVLDSYGLLAVSLNRRSAREELDLDVTDEVLLVAATGGPGAPDDPAGPPAAPVRLSPPRPR